MKKCELPKRLFSTLAAILLISGHVFPQADSASFKLFLIGDAGEDDTTEHTLLLLGKKLKENPNSAVVFLGDNCYRKAMYGLLPTNVKGYDGSKITKARIQSQMNILKDYKGYVYFIPGNHDWWNYTNLKKGKRALLKEEKYIESILSGYKSLKNDSNTFIPDNGHPGPVFKEFNGNKTRIIFIDSYRLILAEGDRKRDTLLLNAFYKNLKNQLSDAKAKKQKIIVVAHHPIHAKGKHSVPLAAWQTLVRRIADSNTNYPPYNRMATHLDSLLKEANRPDLFYVSGHEHSLEYFFTDSLHYIISGAGSKTDQVNLESCNNEGECLQWGVEGFFEIVFYGRKETVLLHYIPQDEKKEPGEICVYGCDKKNPKASSTPGR